MLYACVMAVLVSIGFVLRLLMKEKTLGKMMKYALVVWILVGITLIIGIAIAGITENKGSQGRKEVKGGGEVPLINQTVLTPPPPK